MYAGYEPFIRYAVSVYDIEKDIGKDGQKLGLTFGPALREDYTKGYKSHNPNGVTAQGNAHRCIHYDSWEAIISWNDRDPYVYDQCIDACCTRSVGLSPSKASFLRTDCVEVEGDGVSELGQTDFINRVYMSYSSVYASSWEKSYVRAMLNGKDEYTVVGNDSYVSYSNYSSYADNFTQEVCLFNTLPEVLRSAIAPRLVSNAGTSDKYNVYDKLWLPSAYEICYSGSKDGCSKYRAPSKNLLGSGWYINKESNWYTTQTGTRFLRDTTDTGTTKQVRRFLSGYAGSSAGLAYSSLPRMECISFGFTLR